MNSGNSVSTSNSIIAAPWRKESSFLRRRRAVFERVGCNGHASRRKIDFDLGVRDCGYENFRAVGGGDDVDVVRAGRHDLDEAAEHLVLVRDDFEPDEIRIEILAACHLAERAALDVNGGADHPFGAAAVADALERHAHAVLDVRCAAYLRTNRHAATRPELDLEA